jgi:type II secretory pathway component GspD/PulD (secretin)
MLRAGLIGMLAGTLLLGGARAQAATTSFVYIGSDKAAAAIGDGESEERLDSRAPAVRPVLHGTVRVIEIGLRDLLQQVGLRSGVQINVSPKLRATVRNTTLPADLDGMLNALAGQFSLSWTHQGGAIEVASAEDAVVHVIDLGNLAFETLQSSLAAAGINADDLALKYVTQSNSVTLKGPASLVAQVELIAEAQVKRHGSVRVFRGGKEGP